MEREDIDLIVNDIILNFPKRIEKPAVMFINKKRFSRFLNLMQLKKHLNKTPCFTAKMKGGNLIYFCEEIISSLTRNFSKKEKKAFIEAITTHELLHIWNKIHVFTEGDAVQSEKLVHLELKNFYPRYFKLLESFKTR